MTDTNKIGADRNTAERQRTDYDVDQMYQNLVIHQEELSAQAEELKEAELKRRSAEILASKLFEALPVPYCVLNKRGQIEDSNQSFREITRNNDLSITSKPLSSYLRPISPILDALGSHATPDGEVQSTKQFELVNHAVRRTVPVKVHLTKVEVDYSTRFLLTFTDISSEIAVQNELEQAVELKSRFVANMSHEVRTPLHGIIGNLDLAKRAKTIEEIYPYLESAVRSSEHLVSVVNDVLDYSKLEAGSFALQNVFVSLNSILKDVTELMLPFASSKGLAAHFSSLDSDIEIHIDPVRLKQVLINLLNNAIKFTDAGHVSLATEWSTVTRETGRLSLRVIDTGVGVSSEDLSKLFEPFSQVGSAVSISAEGTGLGLSIVKKLVQLMGGSLRFDSEEGSGTQVSLNFTLRYRDPVKTAITQSNPRQVKPTDFRGLTLLLVDDSVMNRTVGYQMIEGNGGRCLLAENGLEAINLLRAEDESIDCILMDIHMPVMDGVEATKRIRMNSGWCDIPILAVTANVQESEKAEYLLAGVVDVLGKPFTLEDITSAVHRALTLGG